MSDEAGEIKRTLEQKLHQREAELDLIQSVQLALASRLDVQSIYNLVGDRIRDIFDSQVVMISTYDSQTDTMEHRYAIERGELIYAPGRHPVKGFRIQVVQSRQPVLVSSNVAEKAIAMGQLPLPGTLMPKTWLGVPMLVQNQVTGILSLQDLEMEHAFSEAEVRLLQTLAASMSVALENARLWEQEEKYLQSLEHEFAVGREIQAGFLPKLLLQPKGWEIAASLKPAREVAGDFYDVFPLPGEQVGLVIGDVCDKGLGAALLMTLFRSFMRAMSSVDFYARLASGADEPPTKRLRTAITLTNNYIAETHGDSGMFATIFSGILNTHTGVLTYINGGHIPPLLVNREGIKTVLTRTSSAIGAVADAEHIIREAIIEPGDTLFAYTDGMTDTINPSGEYFSEMELLPLLTRNKGVVKLLSDINARLESFTAGEACADDITMLAVKHL